jgi:hypothetical protein
VGSYSALLFDKWEVIHTKSVVPDELCAPFQESDRRAKRSNIGYRAPREVFSIASTYWDAHPLPHRSGSRRGSLESARTFKMNPVPIRTRLRSKRSHSTNGVGASHAFWQLDGTMYAPEMRSSGGCGKNTEGGCGSMVLVIDHDDHQK